MNLRRVVYVVGLLLTTTSLTMTVPLVVAVAHLEQLAMKAFLVSIAIGLAVGALAIVLGRSELTRFYRREGLVVVALAWLVCASVGCLPYVMTGTIPGFIDAYFETMSGFTTTGASVLTDIEHAAGDPTPRSILFWRCMTNWLGGLGIVVLFVALLPALGVGGRLLFHMEVPGVGEKGFMPHIRQTAVSLWGIYIFLTVAECGLLLAAGLGWFDALCHTFATVATGGFSPKNASVGHYGSPWVHVIITAFMFLAGLNFTLYYGAARGRWRSLWRDPEFRVYGAIVLGAITLVTANLLWSSSVGGFWRALNAGSFQVVSIATTTGFATADFDAWPPLSRLLLVLLMFIGASAGSTAGGIKVIRVAVVFRFLMRQIKLHIRPRSVDQIRIGGNTVPDDVVRAVVGMFVLFVALFVLGAASLAAMGLDLTTALSASIASLGNVGPGLGGVGPTCNYQDVPAAGKIVLTLLMLVGRLEIYTALSLFAPILWRD